MSVPAGMFVCHGCGTLVDAASCLPFRCPSAGVGDADHLLVPLADDPNCLVTGGDNPYLRYRSFLSPYRLARRVGLSDAAWGDIVGELDEALVATDGKGFLVTPMAEHPALAAGASFPGRLWVKNETGNVAGSHKARHLMGVMLYLRVLELAKLQIGEGLRERRLAIASCGNAALAATVIARAADWPIDVFIPPDASQSVVRRLGELGARVTVCERRQGEDGDPCFLRFREAVGAGAIPFGVQGSENGLAVEGGRTLALEMAEFFAVSNTPIDRVYVQVGGGALASGLAQGFALAVKCGWLRRMPQIVAVQTTACAPLARAWERMAGIDVAQACARRSQFMWAWENVQASLAGGILDDETYDWLEIVQGMRNSGGFPVIVDEAMLAKAHDLGNRLAGIRVSATGTAGFAGMLATPPEGGHAAVIFSGVER